MRKFREIQEWKYQKKKKPLVFLQEDIGERELLDESLEKFLQKTRVEYRKGRLRTFKEWIKMVRELLDELD
jgi:hypothetical protein|tara:strand:- start:295 stop:507 length:213 start_codon:yes stop_codon:yes gene_type:complete